MLRLDSPVEELKGIGKGRAQTLKKLNIVNVSDVLFHYPRDYEDRSAVTPIAELEEDENAVVIAGVKEEPKTYYFKGMSITKAKIYDASGNINAGKKYAFIGKMTRKKNGAGEIQSPEIEKIGENGWQGGIIPIYPLCAGLSQKVFRKIEDEALKALETGIKDNIPLYIRKKYHLAERAFSIKNIHRPESPEAYLIARKRLVFEELFLLQTALLKLKNENAADSSGIRMDKTDMTPFFDALPFSFTEAQKNVFAEIKDDMSSGRVMQRKDGCCYGRGVYGGAKRVSGRYDGSDGGARGSAF